MSSNAGSYDVIVVGAGHAGCEAALAAARLGCRTLLLTMNLDTVALMPCNPSIGGPAKGHLVREIDALGGEMGRVTDRTFIQIRMLNTGKGPASPGAARPGRQAVRLAGLAMKHVVERQPGLDVKQALVERLYRGRCRLGNARCRLTATGRHSRPEIVVLTTGTSLAGRLIIGDRQHDGGRAGEAAFASALWRQPERTRPAAWAAKKRGRRQGVDAKTIFDFEQQTEIQPRQRPAIGILVRSAGAAALPVGAQPRLSGAANRRLAATVALLSGAYKPTHA